MAEHPVLRSGDVSSTLTDGIRVLAFVVVLVCCSSATLDTSWHTDTHKTQPLGSAFWYCFCSCVYVYQDLAAEELCSDDAELSRRSSSAEDTWRGRD